MWKKKRKNGGTIDPAPSPGNVHMRPALPFLCSSLGGLSTASDDFHLNTAAAPCQEWRPLRATLLREFQDANLTLGGPSVTVHIPYRFGKLCWASLARGSILSYPWHVSFIETTCLSLRGRGMALGQVWAMSAEKLHWMKEWMDTITFTLARRVILDILGFSRETEPIEWGDQ